MAKYRDNIIRKRWDYKKRTKKELQEIKDKIDSPDYLDNAVDHLGDKLTEKILERKSK